MAVVGEDGGWESPLPLVVGRGEEGEDPRADPICKPLLLCWEVASASCDVPALPEGNGKILSQAASLS